MEHAPLASDEGDDDSLILWMLSLSPTQRLEVAQGFVDSVRALRDDQEQANREKDQAALPTLLHRGGGEPESS